MKLYFTLSLSLLTGFLLGQTCNFSIDLPDELILCEAGTTTLSATINGMADEVRWSPLTGLLSPTSATTQAEITADITYTIEARSLSATELITNGDFSQGDTGFSSDYIYATGGGVGALSNEGQYAIASNARDTHRQFARCTDHTGGGQMMVVNASGDPSNVWCQTITVQPNTSYLFSAWVTSVVSENPAQLQFAVNGNLLATPYNASSTTCSWQNFSAEWTSDNETMAEICISNTNFTPAGNDFALDDISFREVCIARDSVRVRIADLQAAFQIDAEICADAPALQLDDLLLNSSTSGGNWQLDGRAISNTLEPSSLSTGMHNLSYTVSDGDCNSNESQTFNIIAPPSAGSLPSEISACFTGPETLDLAALRNGGDVGGQWYQSGGVNTTELDSASGMVTINEAGQYQFTYRVAANTVCSDDEVAITVIRYAPPSLSLPANLSLDCDFPTAELTGQASGNGPFSYRWSQDGNLLAATTPSLTISAAGNYALTLTDTNGCIASATSDAVDQRTELSLSVETLQPPCDNPKGGGIRITDISGGTEPYLSSLDGSSFSLQDTYTDLAAGTYQLQVQDAGGCEGSTSVELFAPVEPTVILTSDQEEPLLLGESISIRALTDIVLGTGDTLFWQPALADSLRTGDLQWRISPLETTTYTLTVINANGCSASASLLVPVVPDGRVFVPNAFSPNGDSNNERFVIYDAGSVDRILELRIFNRWGSEVYQSNSLETNSEVGAWDGTQAGQKLPAGVYIYSLQVEWINGQQGNLSGEINLVY